MTLIMSLLQVQPLLSSFVCTNPCLCKLQDLSSGHQGEPAHRHPCLPPAVRPAVSSSKAKQPKPWCLYAALSPHCWLTSV